MTRGSQKGTSPMTKSLRIGSFALLGSTIVAGCGISEYTGASPTATPSVSANSRPTAQNSVVTNTLTWIAHHKQFLRGMRGTAALQGPGTLPGHAPYSATVQLQPVINTYGVALWETTKPWGINQFNPNQLSKANGTPRYSSSLRVQSSIASWNVTQGILSSRRLRTGTVEALPGTFIKPLGSGLPLRLAGIDATFYTHGTDPGGTLGNTMAANFVLWHQAQWIFEAEGPAAKTWAQTMINTIQISHLPKAQVGVLVLRATRQGTYWTTLTWYQQPYTVIFWSAPGPTNLQTTLATVASWRAWSPHP